MLGIKKPVPTKEKKVDSATEQEETTSIKEQSSKPKKTLHLRTVNIICVIILVIFSFSTYYFADDSKVRVLACEGNYYYTDNQIYDLAGVSKKTRLWLVPSSLMERRVDKQGMIDKVVVKKTKQTVSFKIEEKFAIGYYIDNGVKKILTIDNESIDVDEEFDENLYHLPVITGVTEEQRTQICEALKSVEKDLTRETIEKISEIVPFTSSYDDNMIKLVMRDGNSVFSGMESFGMIVKYQAVLTQLRGSSVCLVLDSEHSAVDKINCDDITTSRKDLQEKQTACEADGKIWDSLSNSCVDKRQYNEDDDEESDENYEGEESEQTEEETENKGEMISYLDTIQDWEYDENSGWYFSPSTGYYCSQYTGQYFAWSDENGDFVEITNEDTLN